MEEGHAMRLAMGRKASGAAEKISMPKPETSPKVNMVEGALMFIFALFVGDVLGSIPYLGVIFKIAAGGAIYLWIKTRGLAQGKLSFLSWTPWGATGLETLLGLLLPGADALLPSYAFNVFLIMILNNPLTQKVLKPLSRT